MTKENKHADNKYSDEDLENMQNIIGLGKFSARKSYYPELQKIIEKLKQEKDKYHRIFSNALYGILQAKLTGEIIVANPAIINLCGYDSEQDFLSIKDIGKSLFVSSFELNKLIFRLKKEKSILGFETRFKKKDNSILDVSLNATLQVTNDYEFVEYFIQDITEKKKILEDLVIAKERAEKSDKLKTEFLAQISHEIRTPLNSIMSYTTLLSDEPCSIEPKILEDIFNSISNSVNRITRTIDLILNASELQANSYDLIPRRMDLYNDVVFKVYNELRRAALLKHLEFKVEKNTDQTILISDEYSIYQIVINLVDNAIKYTNEGEIIIRLIRDSNNKLQLEVEDSGIGISDEFIDHIYEAFSQEEAGYTRRFEGTGLGLSLVKKYCDLNKIELEVKSKKSVGTKFILTFNQRS